MRNKGLAEAKRQWVDPIASPIDAADALGDDLSRWNFVLSFSVLWCIIWLGIVTQRLAYFCNMPLPASAPKDEMQVALLLGVVGIFAIAIS